MTFSVAQVSFKHTYLYSKMINGSSFSSDVNCEKVMKVVILLKNAEDQTIIWESFHIWNLKVETQKSLFFFGGGGSILVHENLRLCCGHFRSLWLK